MSLQKSGHWQWLQKVFFSRPPLVKALARGARKNNKSFFVQRPFFEIFFSKKKPFKVPYWTTNLPHFWPNKKLLFKVWILFVDALNIVRQAKDLGFDEKQGSLKISLTKYYKPKKQQQNNVFAPTNFKRDEWI